MTKNIVIALLLGALMGGAAAAQQKPNNITRADLFEAAALCGILANSSHDPFGAFNMNFFRSTDDFVGVAKAFAKKAQ